MVFDPNITHKHQMEISSDDVPQPKKHKKELKTSVNIPLAASDAFDEIHQSYHKLTISISDSDSDSKSDYKQYTNDPLHNLKLAALLLDLEDDLAIKDD